MKSLIKTDFKLLFWSKVFRRSIFLAIFIVLSNFIPVTLGIMAATSDRYKPVVKLGFAFKEYGNLSKEIICRQVMVSALANTIFFWIIALMLITSFVTSDIIKQRQKSAVINKITVFKLVLSKLIVGSLFLIALYFVTIWLSFLVNLVYVHCTISMTDIVQAMAMIILNSTALICFIWFASIVSILFNSTQYTHLLSFIYFCAGGYYELMILHLNMDNLFNHFISRVNPFVYTMYFSAHNAENRIVSLFIFTAIIILMMVYLLKSIVSKRDYI